MSIEDELKSLILVRYKSMREFSNAISMPYSTLATIFKRSLSNASITNIIKICDALSISADGLADGRIMYREYKNRYTEHFSISENDESGYLSIDEFELVSSYRSLDKKGKDYICQTMSMVVKTHHL
ncbi:MAG: hypothetical protein AB9907_18260 [Flexilinea sp.]